MWPKRWKARAARAYSFMITLGRLWHRDRHGTSMRESSSASADLQIGFVPLRPSPTVSDSDGSEGSCFLSVKGQNVEHTAAARQSFAGFALHSEQKQSSDYRFPWPFCSGNRVGICAHGERWNTAESGKCEIIHFFGCIAVLQSSESCSLIVRIKSVILFDSMER